MKYLKYIGIFALISIGISVIMYIVSRGNVLFLMGGIPLVFGGVWTFKGKDKQTNE